MKQITFAQAKHQNKKKVTRRERFLAEMNVLVPWQRLLDALSPSYYPDAAGKRGRPPTPLAPPHHTPRRRCSRGATSPWATWTKVRRSPVAVRALPRS